MMKSLILIFIVFWSVSIIAGDISGTVKIQRAPDNSDAVVYIEKQKNMQFKPPEKQPAMDQQNLTFTPPVLPIAVGTTVQFRNSDRVEHNIFTPSAVGDMFNLGTWKGEQVKTHTFNKTGEVVLLCNLHPEMEGYIYVAPTPYFAKTDADGNFTITGVPAGSYTLKVWSENGNAKPQKVKVPDIGETTVNFTVK